jgi:hypothetical protein
MTFENLTQAEIDGVLSLVPRAVLKQLARENVVLAGGAIRDIAAGLPVKDLDIFCHSEEQAARLAAEVSTYVKHTLFAYSVDVGPLPIQYVFYKDFKDAADLVSQFDFRACCAGLYWPKELEGLHATGPWEGIAVEGFHADCRDKVLNFMSQQKDAGKLTALGRALKLAQKGWTLSTGEAARIITHFEPTIDVERAHGSFRPGYGGSR